MKGGGIPLALAFSASGNMFRHMSTAALKHIPPKPRIYIETTVICYLTDPLSNDPIRGFRQYTTGLWWKNRLPTFEPVISRSVVEEISAVHPETVAKRLEKLRGINVLSEHPDIEKLAALLVVPGGIPIKAREDAMHLAYCAYHQIPYIVTWNFKHINNAFIQTRLKKICANAAYPFPEISQPFA
jgi:hypothetical protein